MPPHRKHEPSAARSAAGDYSRKQVIAEGVLSEAVSRMLSAVDPDTHRHMLTNMSTLARSAFDLQGPAAFDSSRYDAALHEAGHAVYEAHAGQPVTVLRIFHKTIDGRRQWLGNTMSRAPWTVSAETPPTVMLDLARMVIAGLAAEMFCRTSGRFCFGSSIDEVVLFQTLTGAAAARLGVDLPSLLGEQLMSVVMILKDHEAVLHTVADALIAHGSLKGERLAHLLAPVKTLQGPRPL